MTSRSLDLWTFRPLDLKTSRPLFYVILILFFFNGPVFAGALDMTRLGIGARALAMGRAQTAARDLASIFINPANASAIDRFGMVSMYSNPQEDLYDTVLGVGFPLKEGAMGTIGVLSISSIVSGIQSTALNNNGRAYPVSSFGYASKLMMVSYGKEINPTISAGASLKLLAKEFDGISGGSANGFDMDLGLIFYPKDNLTLGLSAQNLLPQGWGGLKWGTGLNEEIPINFKMGASYSPRDEIEVLVDYDSISSFHLGAEYRPGKMLAIRGGLESFPNALNFSLGVGLKLGNLAFDYAYYIDPGLYSNSAHYFSLSYDMPYRSLELRPFMPAERPSPAIS